MTDGSSDVSASASTSASMARYAGSPSVSKISRTVRAVRRSTCTSLSTNGRSRARARRLPTVVLPAPIIPIRTMWRPGPSAQGCEEAITVAHELVEGVPAELAQRLVGEDEGGHRLGDHAHGGDGGDVGALL